MRKLISRVSHKKLRDEIKAAKAAGKSLKQFKKDKKKVEK